MKMLFPAVIITATMILLSSCNKDLLEYEQSDIKVVVQKGDEWLHDFPMFMGIKKKSSPQIAIWAEDMDGNYITSIYVTHKIATEAWMANKGNRRKEALPVWAHSRGIQYSDGLYLPTKDKPFTDGVSGATPHGSFDVKIRPVGNLKQFIIKIELNHSTDWNDHYPKDAKENDDNYTGGDGGSGQPAVVYVAEIDLSNDRKEYTASVIGHSSPDGTTGEIYTDTSTLTTALQIVKQITINIQ